MFSIVTGLGLAAIGAYNVDTLWYCILRHLPYLFWSLRWWSRDINPYTGIVQ